MASPSQTATLPNPDYSPTAFSLSVSDQIAKSDCEDITLPPSPLERDTPPSSNIEAESTLESLLTARERQMAEWRQKMAEESQEKENNE
jgi:hypothetical protein